MAHLRRTADFWTRLAKQQGYPARSVFKLKEIDHRFKVFRPGQRVCDLGCSPGSWTMFAAERVGPRGFVLGLDLQPLPLTIPLPSHVQLLRQDVFDWSIPSEYRGSFDVLLSDMAPSTSGIKLLDANSSHELCHQALQIAKLILKPNGTLVMKIFEGGGYKAVMREVDSRFSSTQSLKPEATRGESVETFVIAKKMLRPEAIQEVRNVNAPQPTSSAPLFSSLPTGAPMPPKPLRSLPRSPFASTQQRSFSTTAAADASAKHRPLLFRANVDWKLHPGTKPEEFLQGRYSRGLQISFDHGPELRGTASSHVVGQRWAEANAADPEQLLVSALSSCHMLSFLHVARNAGYVVARYTDAAEGVLDKLPSGALAMTRCVLRPTITYSGKAPDVAERDRMHHAAHEMCFIANSVRTEVTVEEPA